MTRTERQRARIGLTWLALALGALALLAMPSLAAAKDRNHDRISDRWEKRHHLSLKVDQARLDQDRDHLRNRAEFLAGDDPRDRDSDDDGVIDGHEQAGTIASFDTATGGLTIDLFGTGTISGLVTAGTEIECEDHSSASAGSEADDLGEAELGDDNGGQVDNSGPGSENSGPEHEGDEDEGETDCTTAQLVPGAVVEEAKLEVAGGQAVFEEVELSGRDA